jgi:Periplasmic copper-binding protein (NosD)
MTVEPNESRLVPYPGLVITRSVRLAPGHHLVPSPGDDADAASLIIRGDDLTVDFDGAALLGTPSDTSPDQRVGTAVRVEGRNVTIRNARIHGYKIGLLGRGAPGLRVHDSDFSYNWKQRLGSTLAGEELVDWMSFHQNERDEWLRYGAAIYLHSCDSFELKGIRATGGQCGFMLTECNHGLIWNNNCTFLSGIGLGLYRSSGNRVMHNRFDWCVRGYAQGVYNRGQDSAAILLYEQSCQNTIAYNSATHSGDGLFLWAGQTTMDSGQGGCNNNLVYGNDFSHAPTNGIEATFSRNTFINNRIEECWHGLWGGYSFDSLLLQNRFADNDVAIAIEHGQSNTIRGNHFQGNRKAVELWQHPDRNLSWGYPRHRDTRSRGYLIQDNFIERADVAIELRDTTGVTVTGNHFQQIGQMLIRQGETSGLRFIHNRWSGITTAQIGHAPDPSNTASPSIEADPVTGWNPFAGLTDIPNGPTPPRPAPLAGGLDPFRPEGRPRGRDTIIVDQWGPYDFRSPKLWPASPQAAADRARVQRFRLLGPPGRWRLVSAKGVEQIASQAGELPGELTVTLAAPQSSEMRLELEYVGGESVDVLGNRTAANQPVPFGYASPGVTIGPLNR